MTTNATELEYDLEPGELPMPERPTPTTLLCAQFRAVEFVEDLHAGPEARVSAWCAETAAPFAVLVLVGPAGAGKTRLLLERCAQLRAHGWHAGFVPAGAGPRVCGPCRPTLVILDYADVHPQLRDHVAAWRAAARPGGPPLRVILVGRALGEWWTTLDDDPRLATVPGHATLVELVGASLARPQRARLLRDAGAQFAARLDKPVPTSLLAEPPDDASPLWIIAAALCRVLGDEVSTEPFVAILDHEARVWRRAMQHHLTSDRMTRRFERLARTVVTALVLRGGADNAREVAGLVSQLAGDALGEFAEVLRELYPGGVKDDLWVRPLAPDLLAELLVTHTLARDEVALERMLAGISDRQSEHAPQVLLRAAQRAGPDAGFTLRWLSRLLAHDLETFAPAVVTAVSAASPDSTAVNWAATLVEVLERRGDAELGRRLLQRIPQHTTMLVDVGAWAGETVGRWLPPLGISAWTKMRAEIHSIAAHFCNKRGDWQRALFWSGLECDALRPLAEEHVSLAARLANGLRNRAVSFINAGAFVEALDTIDDCIAWCRVLQAREPAAQIDGLFASCLDHRGIILGKVGAYALAIAATEESVSLYRRLAERRPEYYRRELAAALDNLGGRYRQTGKFARSLEVTEEALTIYRELLAAKPDLVLHDFLICLIAAASRRARAGALDAASEASEEAVRILRPLAGHHDGLRDLLTSCLTNAATIHDMQGRTEEAARENLEFLSLLDSGARPDAEHVIVGLGTDEYDLLTPGGWLALPPELHDFAELRARAHDLRSQVFRRLGDTKEALVEAEAAVAALSDLGDECSMQRLTLLNNLANRQADDGQQRSAHDTTARVLTSAEELAAAGKPMMAGFIAMARTNLAVRHREIGDHATAVGLATAAVDELRRGLAEVPALANELSRALGILDTSLADAGDAAAAAAAREESARVLAELVEHNRQVLGLAAPLPPCAWRQRLHDLLVAALTPDELRNWLSGHDAGDALLAALPGAPCSASALVCASIDEAERRGLLDYEFFVRLHARLPRHTLQIGLIHALHEVA